MKKHYFIVFIFSISWVTLQAADLKDYLIPVPKQVEQSSGTFNRKEGRIVIPENSPLLIEIAAVIKSCLAELEIVTAFAAKTAIGEDPLVWVYLNPGLSSQEYKVAVQSNRILLEGGDEAGLFYALQTFKQIVRYAKDRGGLPLISIKDSPDFKRRGILLDVSRNKVPTMSTLKNLIDYFASWKINEVQLYTENTFAYQNHIDVWKGFSPMTAEEILELDQYCHERFIDLVPNQASFAHMNQWFEHDRYKGLAEVSGPSSHINLSPAVPETMELMSELYAELLPNFSSRYFNINCDETDYLGKGQTKEWVEKKGKGRVYLDFLMQLKNEVEKHSRNVLFWGDIILQNPELIPELPKDMIALVWGYLADFPFDEFGKKFREAGIPFYVCPGTSSVLSFVGRNQNAFENLRNAAMNGIKHGAMGFLNTDWGNNGHWQPISVSYPAFLYGAAVSWGFKNNENMNIGKMVSRYIFNDPTEKSGDALINIGNAYTLAFDDFKNVDDDDQLIFYTLIGYRGVKSIPTHVTPKGLQNAMNSLDKNLHVFLRAPMDAGEEKIIKAEMTLAVNFAKLACKIGIERFRTPGREVSKIPDMRRKKLSKEFEELIQEHKRIWVLRNKPGGLHKSAKAMEKSRKALFLD